MALFYKGIGVGTHHHGSNFYSTGLTAQAPAGSRTINTILTHIALGTTTTPFISLTRSFGVAEMYASAGRKPPTSANPGHVWEIEIDDPSPPGVVVLDPMVEIAKNLPSPLSRPTYQHDGDQSFLLGVVDPPGSGLSAHLNARVREPPGRDGKRAPNLSRELQAIVQAMRDAEMLVLGTIPRSCFQNIYDVF